MVSAWGVVAEDTGNAGDRAIALFGNASLHGSIAGNALPAPAVDRPVSRARDRRTLPGCATMLAYPA